MNIKPHILAIVIAPKPSEHNYYYFQPQAPGHGPPPGQPGGPHQPPPQGGPVSLKVNIRIKIIYDYTTF